MFDEIRGAEEINVTASSQYSAGYIYNVAVPPQYQRGGRATKVVAELMLHVKPKKALKYKVTNIHNGAHQLYERLQRKLGLALELEGVTGTVSETYTEETKETKESKARRNKTHTVTYCDIQRWLIL